MSDLMKQMLKAASAAYIAVEKLVDDLEPAIEAQATETARLKAELARKDEALRKIAGLDVGRHLDICKDIAKAVLSAEDDALAEGGEGCA